MCSCMILIGVPAQQPDQMEADLVVVQVYLHEPQVAKQWVVHCLAVQMSSLLSSFNYTAAD